MKRRIIMNKAKKIISILLSLLIVISLASCTNTLETEIKSDGSIVVFNKVTLSEYEIDDFYNAYYDIFNLPYASDYDLKDNFPQTKEQFINQSNYEGLTETIGSVQYYSVRIENTYTTELSDLNSHILPVGVGKFSKTDFWLYAIEPNSSATSADSVMTSIRRLGDFPTNLEYEIKLPYKIAKTNATKLDEYTVLVSADDKKVYATTVNSTADWTKADNISNAVENLAKKALTPKKIDLIIGYSQKGKKISVEWGSSSGTPDYFAKYKLQRKVDKGSWKTVKSGDVTSYSDKNIKAGKKYSYRVRGYVKTDDFTVNGDYKTKSLKVANFTAKPKIKVKKGKKKATLTIKNFDKAVKGYQIQYSTNKKFKNAKKVYTSKKKTVIKKLKSGKKYYFRARKYHKDIDGDIFYGTFSKKASAKIK